MLLQFTLLLFVALMLLAAMSDMIRFTIPNKLCIAIAALFPVAALLAGFGWTLFAFHMLAGVLALVLGMALFAPGWIGGGDAKLFAAAGFWFGIPGLTTFLMHTAVIGGLLVIVLLLARKFAPAVGLPTAWTTETALSDGAPVPYGVALAGGAMWSLPSSIWLMMG